MCSYSSNKISGEDFFKLAEFFSHRLESYISPLLVKLDELLDKRLVESFSGLCKSIIGLRSHSTGLLLSELGDFLLSFDNAPAGTKRISNLLKSKKWEDKAINDYFTTQPQQYGDRLLEKR